MPGPRLTRVERDEIAIGTELGETLDQIDEQIGRDPSTVSRERTRNRPDGSA
jgi:IS30 family transposase